MRIGELAAITDTPIETIRYYEREGLLSAPARTSANYRTYGRGHARRLTFIRRCRALDMTLEEVRALLRFMDTPNSDCAPVNALLDEHIGHVAHRISELRQLDRDLRELRTQCQVVGAGDACGILRGLTDGAAIGGSRSKVQEGSHRLGIHIRTSRSKARS